MFAEYNCRAKGILDKFAGGSEFALSNMWSITVLPQAFL